MHSAEPAPGSLAPITIGGDANMRTIVAAAAMACLLTQAASGQTAGGAADSDASGEGDVGGAVGLATSAASDTFFIAEPREYHMLATDLAGEPVFLDATDTGIQRRGGAPAAGEADAAFLEGERPIGTITDLVLDRRGGAAGLVVELDPELPGGDREIAVAMGLVRMLPDSEDVARTHILLSVDPIDIENAPDFQRSDVPDPARGTDGQSGNAAPAEDASPASASDTATEGAADAPQQPEGASPQPTPDSEGGDRPQPE